MSSYITCVDLTDSGPYLTKLLLQMPEAVADGAATPGHFSVFVQRRNRQTGEILRTSRTGFSPESLTAPADGLSQGWRTVTAVYPCDASGLRMSSSELLALEMSYGPLEPLSLCSAPRDRWRNDFVDMDIRITQLGPIPGAPSCAGLVFEHAVGDLRPALTGWQFCDEVTEQMPLRYGWFAPQTRTGQKQPLLIWLHGAGGGGEDPRYPVQGNRVTAFSSPEAQQKLGDAWIFVPQCPTVWMDDGKGTPLMVNNDSMYLQTLKQAIDAFVAAHEQEIDRSRIYLAGASNGGYMTVMQAMTYPGFYAAAVPVCEAVITDLLTDKQLHALAATPMWFVHAKGDFVVPPEKTVIPLFEKLRAIGAPVHFTFWDRIEDTTGHFRNADGTPYSYIPHFAWVPTYNDSCRVDYDGSPVVAGGRAVTLFEWLGMQKN